MKKKLAEHGVARQWWHELRRTQRSTYWQTILVSKIWKWLTDWTSCANIAFAVKLQWQLPHCLQPITNPLFPGPSIASSSKIKLHFSVKSKDVAKSHFPTLFSISYDFEWLEMIALSSGFKELEASFMFMPLLYVLLSYIFGITLKLCSCNVYNFCFLYWFKHA